MSYILGLISRIKALGRSWSAPAIPTGVVVPGQRVQIEGTGDVCVVLRIDQKRHLADVLRLGAVRRVESGIPLVLLTAAQEPPARDNMKISA